MAKCDIHGDPNSNDKLGFRTSKCDISPEFESKVGFRMANAIFRTSKNVKIEFRLSKCDNKPSLECKTKWLSKCNIRPEYECQSRISNVEI